MFYSMDGGMVDCRWEVVGYGDGYGGEEGLKIWELECGDGRGV